MSNRDDVSSSETDKSRDENSRKQFFLNHLDIQQVASTVTLVELLTTSKLTARFSNQQT